MRSSRTREPLLLNKHESSRLIYRFTRMLVVTYFLTDGLSHNKVTQVIKASVSGELRIWLHINCLPMFPVFKVKRVWLKPIASEGMFMLMLMTFPVFQHCSDKNSRCRSEMNILAAWQRGYTGRNVVVTILDDGIERNHPDLAQNYVRSSWSIIAVNAFD